MKPCQYDHCPNAAGPAGVCDDCQGEWRGSLPRSTTTVKNDTGRQKYGQQ